ncbi:hypothetical protein BJX76DRAFT_358504 [Aspergillus varians]
MVKDIASYSYSLELMGGMESNWAKLEPDRTPNDKRGDFWVGWRAGDTWTTAGNQGPGYLQRIKEYPTKQPLPDGLTNDGQRDNNQKKSWVFKRDYEATWLQQASVSASDWWSTTSQEWVDAGHGTVGGVENIICAINHFGQDDVYRLPQVKDNDPRRYNGLCWIDRSTSNNHYTKTGSYSRCIVQFAAVDADGDSEMTDVKRAWEVKTVTILDEIEYDAEDERGHELRPGENGNGVVVEDVKI